MTNPPAELVRPRMRQDVAFLETLDGVYVRGTDGAFVIRGAGAYRYLSALLPHLDGNTAMTDIVAGLPSAHEGAVRSLLGTLAARGVVLDGADSRALLDDDTRTKYASQLALLEHHGDDGTGFARAAAARVIVTSADQQAAATLVEALLVNGVGSAEQGFVRFDTHPDPADADLICLLALDGPSPQLFTLADQARRAATAYLPLYRVGDLLAAGPWQGSVSIHSALLRMSDNGLPGTTDLWQAGVVGAAAAPAQLALANGASTLLISMAGFEVFKKLTGCIAADIDGSVVLVDPDRLTVRTERVLAHPAVPHDDADLEPVAEGNESEGEWAYRRFDRVVADSVGAMRRFDDDAVPQIPVKTAVLRAPAAAAEPIISFGVETVLEARLVALETAAARYALNLHRRCSLLTEPAPDAESVVPEQLETWLGVTRTDGRQAAASDLADQAPLAVPRGAALTGPLDWNAAEYEPELSGLAAGPRAAEAASRALISAVGAAAVAAVARGELPIVRVPDATIAAALDPQQHRRLMILAQELVAEGSQLTFHLGRGVVPVGVVAISNGLRQQVIARSGASWVQAVETALLTAVGERQLAGTAFARVDQRVRLDTDLTGALVAGPEAGEPELTDIVDDQQIVAALTASGRRAAVVDLTPPDLAGVTTVARVLLFSSVHPDPKESR
ncbi:hypothetical protein [Kribbella sp. CA-294648]|uniref:hypothetical protein n=1 Tax=Kribbella sp. CA-294648 TaxID=3239948 RepID=UPI003D9043C2